MNRYYDSQDDETQSGDRYAGDVQRVGRDVCGGASSGVAHVCATVWFCSTYVSFALGVLLTDGCVFFVTYLDQASSSVKTTSVFGHSTFA